MKTPQQRSILERYPEGLPPIAGASPETETKPEDVLAAAEASVKELRGRHAKLLSEVQPLIAERNTVRADFEARLAQEDETKRPTDEERAEHAKDEQAFGESLTSKLAELRELGLRIEQEEALAYAQSLAQRASLKTDGHGWLDLGTNGIESQRDPMTYRRDNQHQFSYFLDLAAHQNQEVRGIPNRKLEGYQERMEAHAKEVAEVMPKRWQERKRAAEAAVERAEGDIRSRHRLGRGELDESPFTRHAYQQSVSHLEAMEQRAPSRIVGQGGYAIPPLWLIDEYIPALRPGRVAAGLCRQMPLPEGTDSINIPRLLTPTLTGIQTADAAPVMSRDFSDTFQQANVKTIAGQEDVPIQLIEQSPGQILDQVLMTDLLADYNKQVDLQVIQGSGVGAALSGGQVVGIYPTTNWGSTGVTWTAATPAPQSFYQVLGVMASKVAYSRFNLQNFAYLMHPRRGFWFMTGLDSVTNGSGRPFVESSGFGPYNVAALEEANAPAEGLIAQLPFGPRLYVDANVPITDGSGVLGAGSADVAFGAIWDDLWLFEGDLRTRVLAEVLSGTLELRFQIYNYVAFLARYGVSIAQATGTGFAAPTTINDSVSY